MILNSLEMLTDVITVNHDPLFTTNYEHNISAEFFIFTTEFLENPKKEFLSLHKMHIDVFIGRLIKPHNSVALFLKGLMTFNLTILVVQHKININLNILLTH